MTRATTASKITAPMTARKTVFEGRAGVTTVSVLGVVVGMSGVVVVTEGIFVAAFADSMAAFAAVIASANRPVP